MIFLRLDCLLYVWAMLNVPKHDWKILKGFSAPCNYTTELKLKMSYRSITQVAIIDALWHACNSSPNLIILLSPTREYNMSPLFAPCIARIVRWKLWLPTPKTTSCRIMSMSKTKNAEIAHCLPLSGLLHTFADYLRNFSFFLHAVCLRFGAFGGDQLTTGKRQCHA